MVPGEIENKVQQKKKGRKSKVRKRNAEHEG